MDSVSEASVGISNSWKIKIICYNLFNERKDSGKVLVGHYYLF